MSQGQTVIKMAWTRAQRECWLESDGEKHGPGWYRNIWDKWKTLSHFMWVTT